MTLQEKLYSLPSRPGVYLFKDSQGETLYVGKARSLKDRVTTYFSPAQTNPRLTLLVRKISDLDYILTDSELEALVLEYHLIKELRPPFNVRFRDDKRLPYIKLVIRDPFPYLTVVRQRENDGNLYFGPYGSSGAMREALRVMRKIFGVRSCTMKITGNERECLYYHMGECLAPCIKACTTEEYQDAIKQVTRVLQGKGEEVIRLLEERMAASAKSLVFEEAARIRDRITALQKVLEKPKVLQSGARDEDLIALAYQDGIGVVSLFKVRGGVLLGKEHVTVESVDVTQGKILSDFIQCYYGADIVPKMAEAGLSDWVRQAGSRASITEHVGSGERSVSRTEIPPRILMDQEPEDPDLLCVWLAKIKGGEHRVTASAQVQILVPRSGEGRKLLDLLKRNAWHQLRLALIERQAVEGAPSPLLEIKERLHLLSLPVRIEGYDISNVSGKYAVGSMVVFEAGKPKKSHYRKFKVKALASPDDPAMLREILIRRLAGLHEGDDSFSRKPDLLLIDGGKEQLKAALKALEEFSPTFSGPACGSPACGGPACGGISEISDPTCSGIFDLEQIPVVALSKGGEHGPRAKEEIYTRDAPDGQQWERSSRGLRVLQFVRDEAHRTAIAYHRTLRGKGLTRSGLDKISGIGKKRSALLLRSFGSLEGVRKASMEELQKILRNRASAKAVYESFRRG